MRTVQLYTKDGILHTYQVSNEGDLEELFFHEYPTFIKNDKVQKALKDGKEVVCTITDSRTGMTTTRIIKDI